jgi:hypothetical protein
MFRGHGVNDLVNSLRGEPLRVSGQFALHVLEVLEAMEQATFAGGVRSIADAAVRPAAVPPAPTALPKPSAA